MHCVHDAIRAWNTETTENTQINTQRVHKEIQTLQKKNVNIIKLYLRNTTLVLNSVVFVCIYLFALCGFRTLNARSAFTS